MSSYYVFGLLLYDTGLVNLQSETYFRSSPKVPYVDETALEMESNEISEESRELLSIYHKTFDDDRVSIKMC